MVKVVTFFLIGMIALALFGRLRLPPAVSRRLPQPKTCPACGRYRIGKGPCPCGRKT